MHILVIEVNLTGHHSIYLEKVAEAHLDLGREITVVVSEDYKAHVVISRLRKLYSDLFHVVFLDKDECAQCIESSWGGVGREIGLWRLFRKIFHFVSSARPVNFVFLPYTDYCLNAIGLLGSPFDMTKWGGICMRPSFHYAACGVIAPDTRWSYLKRLLFNRVLRLDNLVCLFSIDELLVRHVHRHDSVLARQLHYLPDPAGLPLRLDVIGLRQQYNIPISAKVVLVYGSIDGRKGLFRLLDSLALFPELIEWHALIVGRQSPDVREALSSQQWASLKEENRLHTIDDFVSGEVEHQVFSLCDAVWAAYVGHYTMSGVLVRAGMYRKPVIANGYGLIGWYARTKKLGIILSNSKESVVAALRCLAEPVGAREMGDNGHRQFAENTWSFFVAQLAKEFIIHRMR